MRKWFFLLLCVVCFIPVAASAHSGRTDGSGGHWNRSAGVYHYHHGYSAHDHYDMDGDGIVDCPYEFEDKTEKKQYIPTIYRYTGINETKPSSDLATETLQPSVVQQNGKETNFSLDKVIFIAVIAIIFVIWLPSVILYNRIQRLNSKHFEELASVKSNCKAELDHSKSAISLLHKMMTETNGDDYLYKIAGAPEDSYVDEKFLPHSKHGNYGPYIDKYTFYLGTSPYNSNVKYHHRSCRYANGSYEINAYDIKKHRRYSPCLLCPCRLPDTEWVDQYKELHSLLSKYITFDK